MKKRLKQFIEEIEDLQDCLILVHNNPDPDAIASAVALQFLLNKLVGLEPPIAYRGIIGRAENKALVRYLNHPLTRLAETKREATTQYALVDTQPGAGNNPLPPDANIAIVIDHHPLQKATKTVRFADVRSEVGAASSILTIYLKTAGFQIPPFLATALFYGIKTDTMGLGRGTGKLDMKAICHLLPLVDLEGLLKIERAQVPISYFKSLTDAFQNTRIYDKVIISYLGKMDYPDLTAETADLFLRARGSVWVICMGLHQNKFVISIRTHRKRGAGALAQKLVGDLGVAGGHNTMAGGVIRLDDQDPQQLATQLTQQALSLLEVSPETQGQALVEIEN